jgi:hypothetical protein
MPKSLVQTLNCSSLAFVCIACGRGERANNVQRFAEGGVHELSQEESSEIRRRMERELQHLAEDSMPEGDMAFGRKMWAHCESLTSGAIETSDSHLWPWVELDQLSPFEPSKLGWCIRVGCCISTSLPDSRCSVLFCMLWPVLQIVADCNFPLLGLNLATIQTHIHIHDVSVQSDFSPAKLRSTT